MSHHFYHAHEIIEDRCAGRMKCLHACPTQAIRVRNGKAAFLNQLCIDCGECISVCPEQAWVAISDDMEDFTDFKYQLAFPSAILYTQFGSGIHPSVFQQALKNVGFDAVIDAAEVLEELGLALRHHLKSSKGARPLISSFCPTVVRLIQVNYPNLVNFIEPFDVPREIVAKEAKKKFARKWNAQVDEIGIIYMSPCPAKMVSIKQPAEKEKSWIDGTIPIKEIYNLILPEILKIQESAEKPDLNDFYFGKNWGIHGTMSRIIDPDRSLSVTGITHLKKIFDDIENSKLRNVDFVEALACMQGCVGGAFCVENPYIARHNAILMEKKFAETKSVDKNLVLKKYKDRYYYLEHQVLPRVIRPVDRDISASIKKMRQRDRILMKLPKKDCGLCGSPDCATFAEDCAGGDADLTDCIFFS